MDFQASVPEEVFAGTDFSFTVIVVPPSGLDLSGAPFRIVEGERIRAAGRLPALADDRHTVEVRTTAPENVGAFEWTFVVGEQETDGIVSERSSVTFSFRTAPHSTSLAVWDAPAPVVISEKFTLTVGAKCTAGCRLRGARVNVHDQRGAIVAGGVLHDEPWPGTTALYWTTLEATAPAEEEHVSWSLQFSVAGSHLPHGEACAAFSFVTVRPPEHEVCVKVVERHAGTPIHDAQVRLGVYRAATDEAGIAQFAVPAGEHRLFIWKAGYDAPSRTVDVNRRELVEIEVAALPVENPNAYWKG